MKKLYFLLSLLFLSLNSLRAQEITFYGMTYDGSGLGTIFQYTTGGSLTTLVSLGGSSYGVLPSGNLIKAYDGNLYGMTYEGGSQTYGTIFKMTPSGVISTLVNFNFTDGANPYGSLLQAPDSNFYGLTWGGGIYGSCCCFMCTPSGNITVLADFEADGVTGNFPYGNIIQTSNGNLYGLTCAGGTNNLGTIFVKTPLDTLTNLSNFNDTNGALPYGSLIQATDGNFYGMTSGQYNPAYSILEAVPDSLAMNGNIFRADTAGNITTIYRFDSIHGKSPYGSLIQASDGNLYGMTSKGGIGSGDTSSYGTLFVCTLEGSLTTLVQFNDSTGTNPYGSLIQASDGNLYGMTQFGGKYGYGTIFKCTLTGLITTLVNFNDTNGANPKGDLLEWGTVTTRNNTIENKFSSNLYPNPNNGEFTISISGITEKSELDIYNVLGENIYTATVRAGNNQINLGNKPAGVYLYKIITPDGSLVKEGKIVVE